MKFKGRNGGMAVAIRNHIMLFRVFVISLLISIIPIMFFICAHNPYFWIFLIIPLMSFVLSFAVFLFIKYDENVFLSCDRRQSRRKKLFFYQPAYTKAESAADKP